MRDRKPYKGDLSDARWALLEPVITARKAQRPSVGGHVGRYEMREIVGVGTCSLRCRSHGVPQV